MARTGSTGIPNPYRFFGTYAGLPFSGGGLTLLAAAPGIGKTSWMLRMLLEAASERIPCAIGCYEHTEDELKYRLSKQAEAKMSGPHRMAISVEVEAILAKSAEGVLLALNDKTDTIHSQDALPLRAWEESQHKHFSLSIDYRKAEVKVTRYAYLDEHAPLLPEQRVYSEWLESLYEFLIPWQDTIKNIQSDFS